MDAIFGFTVLLYLCCTLWFISYLIFQKEFLYEIAQYHVWAILLAHSIHLINRLIDTRFVWAQNFHDTFSIMSWSIIVFYILFHMRYRVKILGVIVVPLTTFFVIIAYLTPAQSLQIEDVFQSTWLTCHILFSFLGNAALATAFATGCLYLMQEFAIKTKKRGFFYRRLPSLELLDSTGYASVVAGFSFLTLGIITGSIYAQMVWHRYWSWDPKEVWSVITWLIYAALLHGRLSMGWRGKRSAIISIIGFFALIFTFLGVNFLLKGHHVRFTQF